MRPLFLLALALALSAADVPAAIDAKLREADAVALAWLKSLDLSPLPPVAFADPKDHRQSEDAADHARADANFQFEIARDILAGKRWPHPEPGETATRVRCLVPELAKALALRPVGVEPATPAKAPEKLHHEPTAVFVNSPGQSRE